MSKLLMFDFQCRSCGLIFEDLTKPDVVESQCQCGGTADRQIACPKIGLLAMATSASASPASIKMFDRLHQQQKAKEERCFACNGDYGKRPGSD